MKFFILFLFTISVAIVRAEKPKEFVIAPTQGEGPFPVVVWLHGYRGYSSDGYVPDGNREAMQKHADQLGAVIIGFPATADLGDETQQWSEEPVADHAYVQMRLKKLAKAANLDLTRVGLFGFSQGAMVAADLAACYPGNYRGAILMSPGGLGTPKATEERQPAHTGQVYYCFCGAEEHPGNVQLTAAYARHLQKVLGARVTVKLYEGQSEHKRPEDFTEKFVEWMGEILKKSE